ncbi:MAG: hypothetical protein RRC34_07780 [Lentisphaeria bacterium]|nr:hypothetical protein [Lentisphaeria bacterium]
MRKFKFYIILDYNVTEKTAVFIYGDYQHLDGDGNANITTVYSLRGGFKTFTTDKFTLRAGVGTMFSEVDTLNGTGTNSDTSFNFYAQGGWHTSEKIELVASARNFMKVASDVRNNAREITEFSVGTNYNISKSLRLNATGAYAVDEYVNQVAYNGDFRTRKMKMWMGRARLTYTPPVDYLAVYIEGQYSYVDDDLYEDYEQYRVSVGVKLWY